MVLKWKKKKKTSLQSFTAWRVLRKEKDCFLGKTLY